MLLSRREYAKYRGVDDKAVRNAIATKRITTINGMINPEVADKEWDENTKHEYLAPVYKNEDRGNPVLHSTRDKRETLDLMLKKLDYEERLGKLIPRAEVETDVFNAARAARDRWMGAPHKIASQIIGKTDIAEIEQILTKEFESFLEVLTSCLRGNQS